jgi:hypothetical protein
VAFAATKGTSETVEQISCLFHDEQEKNETKKEKKQKKRKKKATYSNLESHRHGQRNQGKKQERLHPF